MEILKSIDRLSFEDLANNYNQLYFEEQNIAFKQFSSGNNQTELYITDLSNALKPGKEVTEYIFKGEELWNVLFFRFELSVSEVLSKLYNKEVEGIEYFTRTHKAIRVFSPFVEVKKVKEPKKWTISHVWKAILSGQITQGQTDQRLTDDYAFDAATNFGKGSIDVKCFAKDLIESPSGWWINVDEETEDYIKLGVNCYQFDYKTLYFNKKEVAAFEEPIIQEEAPSEAIAFEEPAQEVPSSEAIASKVIDFQSFAIAKRAKTFEESLTPEQKFKMMLLSKFMGEDQVSDLLTALDFNIDKLFTIAAEAAIKSHSLSK